MVLQDLLAGGVEYVQDSQPSDADAGEIWLDTSVDPSALKIYDASSDVWDEAQASNLDAPVSNIQDEIQSGRTRELLLLLQDKPVPEVAVPMSPVKSTRVTQDGADYNLLTNDSLVIDDFEDGDTNIETGGWSGWTGDMSIYDGGDLNGAYVGEVGAGSGDVAEATAVSDETLQNGISLGIFTGKRQDYHYVALEDSGGNKVAELRFDEGASEWQANDGGSLVTITSGSQTTAYNVKILPDYTGSQYSIEIDGTVYGPYSMANANEWDTIHIYHDNTNGDFANDSSYDDVALKNVNANFGYTTDRFSAPTTPPADFKQWNAIQARDVTVGGSTSADPVEFEILDSADTVLNSTRIPKARIADEPFTMRNRVYSESAGSDGQSDYQIATTGDGGHFGIPILTVVSVKQNGSVLDSDNWSFDGDTTVTIDTSNISIASGDTIDIKYDFDVFDSTLQPRAYLSREDTSEDSPSISHFRYEYVI